MTTPPEDGPVRVGRFEWERLMMMGDLPHEDRFKLLVLGIFMSADGSRMRPGNSNLALFAFHEETWKQLLRRATKAGWLVLIERGGARRGVGGTTVRRASVYAAAVPRAVWERREEILSAPPYRAPSVEGSPETAPDSMKEAPDDQPAGSDDMKEASDASFEDSDGSMKEASGGILPGSLKEASDGFEGSIPGFEGSLWGLPHHVGTSRTTNTVAAAGKPAAKRQRKPSEHPVADELTDAFWKVHGKGRAQKFVAVREVVRTAIGNGVERDELARALDQVVREGRSVSGATLDIALGHLKRQRSGGVRKPVATADDWKNKKVEIDL